MKKNEFLVRMHDVMEKVHFLTAVYGDNMICPKYFYEIRERLLTESEIIRNSYFSDANTEREVLSKEEMNYIFGWK